MASQEQIFLELIKLYVAYPQAQRVDSEMPLVLGIWFEGLEGISDDLMVKAMAQHRKASRFFPLVAEIREMAMTIERQGSREAELALQRKALPRGPLTDDERAKHIAHCQNIRGMINLRSPAQPVKKYREPEA